jgi:hypothetical protein
MRYRPDRENLDGQRAAVAGARGVLARELAWLSSEANAASRIARRPKGRLDLTDVYTAHTAVLRAEEALDLAELDLRTAAGEDA